MISKVADQSSTFVASTCSLPINCSINSLIINTINSSAHLQLHQQHHATTLPHHATTLPHQYHIFSDYHDYHLHIAYLVIFPVLITIGVLANLLDLWVLSQPSMQGTAFRYLARLAASDLLYLIFNIPFCLKDFALTTDGLLVSQSSAFYFAHIAVPIVNFFLTLSVYIIVWLSYDRWLAVCKPQIFPTKQNLQVVHRRSILTFIVTLIFYVPSPFRHMYCCLQTGSRISSGSGSNLRCCVQESQLMKKQWFYLYEFIREIYSRFLPGILITAFNGCIIFRLAKRGRLISSIRGSSPIATDLPSSGSLPLPNTSNGVEVSPQEVCSSLVQRSICCSSMTVSPVQERIELGSIESEKKSSFDGEYQNHLTPSSHHSSSINLKTNSPYKTKLISVFLGDKSNHDSCIEASRMRQKYATANDSRGEREICLVFLLLAITVFFYISSFPSALYKIMPINISPEEEHVYDMFRAVADVLEVSGHVFNFCLYFILSPEFRRTLLSLLPFLSRSHSSATHSQQII